MLSTGSTLLNLRLSGRYDGGLMPGKMMLIVGDSSAGKTFQALTMLAEAAHNPNFKDYELYYDDAENADEFDKNKLFGKQYAKRVQSPYPDKCGSETLEEFYYTLDSLLDKGKPIIYVMDSMDSVPSIDEEAKFDEAKAFEKGNKPKGSYGDGKAKVNSQNLRKMMSRLESTGIGNTYVPKTRSGGNALKFYASYEVWMAPGAAIKTMVNKIDRPVGKTTKIKITKNKATGMVGEVEYPLYYHFGIDDAASMVDFLLAEGKWKSAGAYVDTDGFFDKKMFKKDVIDEVYKKCLLSKLGAECQKVWEGVEAQIRNNAGSYINAKYGEGK